MPSKKRKRTKPPPRKTAGLRQQDAPVSPLSLLANPSDLRGLEIFLSQTRGFRLALALHDDMRVRDQINQYLQEKLQASGVDLLLVDLHKESADISLLGSAAAAFSAYAAKPRRADRCAALALVNLESRVNYNPELCNGEDQKSAYLATANLQRDLWPASFNGPVLIWMSELLEPAIAKWAPDLWHWRSHVFDLRKMQSEKVLDALLGGRESRLDLSGETQVGSARRLAGLQTQLDAYRKAGKREDAARLLHIIGEERLTLGQSKLAKQNFEAGLVVFREIPNKHAEGRVLGSLGNAWSNLGESRRALECYEQSLTIAREIGDKLSEGTSLGNLGNAWAILGENSTAMMFYEQALAIAREVGNKRGEGHHLGNLGNTLAKLGKIRQAIDVFQEALSIARAVGDESGESSFLGNLGNAWGKLGEIHRAIEFHKQALAIALKNGNKRSEGADLGNLGNAWASLGDLRVAIEFHEQAVTIFREIGDKRGEGENLFNLALTLRKMGAAAEQQQAVVLVKEALAIFEAIESPNTNAAKATLAQWQAEK